jgi:hypothetical protein
LLSGFFFGGCAFPFWEIIVPSDQPYQGLSKFTILSLRVLSLLSYKSEKFTLRLLFWWLWIELRIFSKFEAIAIFGNDDQFDLTIRGQMMMLPKPKCHCGAI